MQTNAGILTNSSHIRNLRQFFSIKTLTNTIIVPAHVAYMYDRKKLSKESQIAGYVKGAKNSYHEVALRSL